jgi:hypothetical protein
MWINPFGMPLQLFTAGHLLLATHMVRDAATFATLHSRSSDDQAEAALTTAANATVIFAAALPTGDVMTGRVPPLPPQRTSRPSD